MEKLNRKPIARRPGESLEKQITEVEKKIKELIKEDTSLKHLFELVTSVDGVGEVVFCEMVIATARPPGNEFKLFSDRRPVALESSLATQSRRAVALFEHTSGTSSEPTRRGRH